MINTLVTEFIVLTGQNNKAQFAKPGAAQKAAALLGLPVEELLRQVFSSSGSGTLTRGASVRLVLSVVDVLTWGALVRLVDPHLGLFFHEIVEKCWKEKIE